MTSLKLVIDTNILISAALSAQGAPAKLVQLALAQHRLVFSQATLDELRTRLYWPKFDRYISLESRERLLHDFNASALWVDVGEAALKAQAHFLVSGDKDLLEAPDQAGLRIVSVHQALDALGH